MKTIRSRNNPLVKTFRAARRSTRQGRRHILLDGARLIQDAHLARVPISIAMFATTLLRAPESGIGSLARTLRLASVDTVAASEAVLKAASPVRSPSGIVALAPYRPASMRKIGNALQSGLVLAAVNVQDPGNVGAIVRAADAGGAAAVVVTSDSADPYGWRALRGAMGSTFRIPVTRALSPEVIGREATTRGWKVIAAVPKGGTWLAETNLGEPCLLWLGSEGKGLDQNIISAADGVLSIPMRKPVESLNLAVTAALIIYEAAQQRGNFNPETADRTRHRRRLA